MRCKVNKQYQVQLLTSQTVPRGLVILGGHRLSQQVEHTLAPAPGKLCAWSCLPQAHPWG